MLTQLKKVLKNFSGKKVLVIGDLMWDEYIRGSATRVSPEAPVPVVLANSEERIPGGATNVLRNLVDLKVTCGVMGVVGDDNNGQSLKRELSKYNLNMLQVWQASDRPTTIKTRILAQNQQLLRLDREQVKNIPASIESRLLDVLSQEIRQYHAVILSDYDKGVLTPSLITEIITLGKKHKKIIAVDPQVKNFGHYKGATVITPNETEASTFLNERKPATDKDAVALGKTVMKTMEIESLLLTRSEKGMAAFLGDNAIFSVPASAREVFDVTGAGDTVIAVYTSALAAGGSPEEAAILANLAGGIVVGKVGTATVKRRELSALLAEDSIDDYLSKTKYLQKKQA